MLLMVGLFCRSCYLNDKETSYSRGEGRYTFDPATVLAALARGEEDVFVAYEGTPGPTAAVQQAPVCWGQAGFLHLVQALHQQVWHDRAEDWGFRILIFLLDCEDVPFPQQFGAILFRPAPPGKDGRTRRFERHINIDLRQGTIEWHESEISPNWHTLPPLDLDRITVTAEQALQIAEQQGGRDARLGVGNECQVRLTVVGGLRDNDWEVDYARTVSAPLFTIRVDEQTGAYRVVSEGK
jgi:hypothetical protein